MKEINKRQIETPEKQNDSRKTVRRKIQNDNRKMEE